MKNQGNRREQGGETYLIYRQSFVLQAINWTGNKVNKNV
jgi:hypothetical protein